MIELELNKIKIDESRSEQLIVFREKEGVRFLPLVIGINEVHAIKMKLSGMNPPRPLTHDLFCQMLEILGARVEKVLIDKLQNSTFYAKLVIRDRDQKVIELDARPSDCVAIATRLGTPLFASEEVLGQAGVTSL